MNDDRKVLVIGSVAVVGLLLALGIGIVYGNHEGYESGVHHYDEYLNSTEYPDEYYPQLGANVVYPPNPPVYEFVLDYPEVYDGHDVNNMTVDVVIVNQVNASELTYTGMGYYLPTGDPYGLYRGEILETGADRFNVTYAFEGNNTEVAFIQVVAYSGGIDSHYYWGVVRDHLTLEDYVFRTSPWVFNYTECESCIGFDSAVELNERVIEFNSVIDEYDRRVDVIQGLVDDLLFYEKYTVDPMIGEIKGSAKHLSEINNGTEFDISVEYVSWFE